jgi:restriction system protein
LTIDELQRDLCTANEQPPGGLMSLPDFQAVMLPLLQFLVDDKEHSNAEQVAAVSSHFNLTEEDRARLLPSGQQTVIANRVGWSRTYMKKAGLLVTPRRGVAVITEEGHRLLAEKPAKITVQLLKSKYPAFATFHGSAGDEESTPTNGQESQKPADVETPQERLEKSYQQIRAELAAELLDKVLSCSPAFFEQLVVDLLVAMGYGGSVVDAGQSLGKSGDDGIDGIIKEDRLGLDVIYLQAKRWQGSVGRPVIQAFAGSLEGHRARKGVIITTSTFTQEARDYVTRIEKKIVLIDGKLLAQLMIDHDVGVAAQKTFTLKRIDSDYFEIEE